MGNLKNIGYNYGFIPGEIRRFGFTLYKNDAGTVNKISLSNAATLAQWQALVDIADFETDPSVKVVFTPLCYAAGASSGDPTEFNQNGYYRILRRGLVEYTFTFYDIAPKLVEAMQDIANYSIAAYCYDSDTCAIGVKDGTDLKPLRIQRMSIPDYTPPTFDTVATLTCKFTLETGGDTANMVKVAIANAEITDEEDFYSLRDVTATVSAPATTGCDVILSVDNVDPSSPATAIYLTGASVLYTTVTFRDQSGGATKTLAAAGSISYNSTTHKHTINESALLTSGHSYDIEVRVDGYNCKKATVTVP